MGYETWYIKHRMGTWKRAQFVEVLPTSKTSLRFKYAERKQCSRLASSFKYSFNRVLTEVWAEGLGKSCTIDRFSLHTENWRNYRCKMPLRSAVFSHEMFVLLFFLSSGKPKEGAWHSWGNLSPWSFNPCICFSYPHPFFEQNCFMKSHPLVE